MRRLFACLVIACAAGPAPAEAPPRLKLPPPGASATRVREALDEASQGRPQAGIELVQEVCQLGGPSAALALALLAERSDQAVRTAALHAVSVLRLRSEALRSAALAALAGAPPGDPELRVAAVEALGWTGDGRDVPRLLQLADDEDPALAAMAALAFRALTGVVSIAGDRERRIAWWAGIAPFAQAELAAALAGLEDPEAKAEVPLYRQLVRLRGLYDIEGLRDRTREWFAGSSRARIEAARVVATFRLADLTPEVISLAHFATDAETRREAATALAALGIKQVGEPARTVGPKAETDAAR